MSLIKCSECEKEISDKAQVCPNCGNPIKPVVIEQTSKKWKKRKVIYTILLVIGLLMFMTSFGPFQDFDGVKFSFGFIILIIGGIGLMASNFGAWWSNR